MAEKRAVEQVFGGAEAGDVLCYIVSSAEKNAIFRASAACVRGRQCGCASHSGTRLRLFNHDPGRRAAMKQLTGDEARRIATNIAKIPAFRRGGVAS